MTTAIAPRPITILPNGQKLFARDWEPVAGERTREPLRFPTAPLPVPTSTRKAILPREQSAEVYAPINVVAPHYGDHTNKAVFRSNGPPARNVTQFGSLPLPAPQFGRTADEKKDSRKRILQRVRRFRRLRTARKIMHATKMGVCMVFLNDPDAGGDIVLRNAAASYCGVWRCGYRTCPFCGPWLAARDAEKSLKLITGWVKRGNAIGLCAYTMRHYADESPEAVWDAHTKVLHSLHSGSKWRAFVEKYGLCEYIYGNEVTLGDNGCHKHQHRAWEVLWRDEFRTAAGLRAFGQRMQAEYEPLYLEALAKHGRSALPGIALQLSIAAPSVKNAGQAAEYVSKFAKEISQGGMKSGHKGNRNLWELLDDGIDHAFSDAQRARARMRFKEVSEGTHGKHWWHASESTTDDSQGEGEEEIPEQEEEKGTPVLHFSAIEYRKLAKLKCESRLLTMVELKGPEYARAWLTRVCDPARWPKNFGQEKGPAPPVPRYAEWGEDGF